jgi:hypothetical protein
MKLILILCFCFLYCTLQKDCKTFDSFFTIELSGNEGLCIPMSEERQTDEYKQRAIDFFYQQYGWDMSGPVNGVLLMSCQLNPNYTSIITNGYSNPLQFGLILLLNLSRFSNFQCSQFC